MVVANAMRFAVITRISFNEDRFSPVKPASEQGDYEKDDDDAWSYEARERWQWTLGTGRYAEKD